MKKKSAALAAAVFLLLSLPLTVLAIRGAVKPAETRGAWSRTVVDRADFAVDKTEFLFVRPREETAVCEISFTLTARKCEADFYAVIEELRLTGLDFIQTEFHCATPGAETEDPTAFVLPVKDGQPQTLQWNVTAAAPLPDAVETPFALEITYISGLTPDSAAERVVRIPLKLIAE